MPTYEYRCQKCRRLQEAFQSITAKPLRKCTRCGGTLKRLLGRGSGFIFKGSGFYITDYRSKKYQEAKKKDQPPSKSSKESSKPASSTEKSKPKPSASGDTA